MDTDDLSNLVTRLKALWSDIHYVTSSATPALQSEQLLADARAITDDLSSAIAKRQTRLLRVNLDDELVKFLEGTVGFVEDADSYARHSLWERNQAKGWLNLSWENNNQGFGETIGYVDNSPIHISLWSAIINGHKIIFIEPTSMIVHHDMIREWLEKVAPETARRESGSVNKTNTDNFYNIIPRDK